MTRTKHPNKEIEQALLYAEKHGWIVKKGSKSAHSWGKMYCPSNNQCRNGIYCIKSIWSTPKSSQNHAKSIKEIIDKCEFGGDNNE